MAGGFQASSRVVVVLEMSLCLHKMPQITSCVSSHLLSTVRRCGGEVAPSTAPVQAAADTLMVSTEEGREVPCNRSVLARACNDPSAKFHNHGEGPYG